MANEPLTAEYLAVLRAHAEFDLGSLVVSHVAEARQVLALLDEIERLRARVASLEADNALVGRFVLGLMDEEPS